MENKFIIVVVVTLLLVALAQLMKVYDLASKSRGDRSEEKVTKGENIFNANLLLVFMVAYFAFIIWLILKFGMNGGMFEAASEHGQELDSLLLFNWWIILPVFFLTNGVLFVFSWKYYYREERKALFFTHSNKLELIWTIVPAIALSFIVIYGLITWNEIMYNDVKGAKVVEVYARQFDWHTRYSGEKNVLGKADYKLITENNPLGIITEEYIQDSYEIIDKQILSIENLLSNNEKDGEYLLPNTQVDSLNNKMDRLKRKKTRIKASIDKGADQNKEIYNHAYDDILVKELRLIKDQPYSFRFRSKDVLHCPWIPHMRMQMNAVPGMETRFDMTPTTTTEEMRSKPEVIAHYNNISKRHHERLVSIGEKSKSDIVEPVVFNYILMCNKICGAQHSNMQMEVVVETEKEFSNWLKENKKETISNQIASLIKKKIDALSGYESNLDKVAEPLVKITKDLDSLVTSFTLSPFQRKDYMKKVKSVKKELSILLAEFSDQYDVYSLSLKYARSIFDNMSDETKKVLLEVKKEGDPTDYELLKNKLEKSENNVPGIDEHLEMLKDIEIAFSQIEMPNE